ncbi:MAG TPA: lipopolysaccharide kinase InaA family protein [Thermodesulfobacteriota bacterium]|nr:lipopolysaccharide kinase InaA family protein [Thermodesulfobacteriota bacterium]
MTQLTNRADSITLVKMFKHIQIPASFSLIEKGKVFLLLKEEYKNLLLAQGIDDLKTFLEKNRRTAHYLKGRIPHPSIPFENGKRLVLRQYSHGGLFRAITGSLYFVGARSFRELALTEEIRSCGIPTILSVGAIHHRLFFPFYRAYFISLEVPRAMDLIRYFGGINAHPSREEISSKRKTIRSTGLLIRQFHQAGFFHRDLQLKNILVAGDQVLLIDFDRSYRKSILSANVRMKNLLRLNRSVEKWRRLGLSITRTDRWRFFLAYAGDDKKIKERMRKTLRTYSLRSLFYRFSWTLEKILGSRGRGVEGIGETNGSKAVDSARCQEAITRKKLSLSPKSS